MKQAKFQSYTYLKDYVEETADGELVEHSIFVVDNGEVVADIIEERKHTLRLKLSNGKEIVKKRSQVETF